MKVTIKNQIYYLSNSSDAINEITQKLKSFEGEIWIEYTEEIKLCLLLNQERIYLMYLNNEDYWTASDESVKDNSLVEEFILENGQVDEYFLKETLPRKSLFTIIEKFVTNPSNFMEVISYSK